MNKLASLLFFIAALTLNVGCNKSEDNPPAKTPPTNLVITANVSTDGSGKVSFRATADNAATYAYEFGNGEIKTVPTGIIDYVYTLAGNNTFTVGVTATSSTGLSLKKEIQVTVYVLPGTPTLLWSDEFNVAGAPDPSKWGYDIGTGSGGWGNNELQYYTNRSENVSVANGVLKITAIKENFSGSNYTSARLLTKGKFAFTYGKVEARAKLPAGVGTWPAIWSLGNNISTAGWPACGEIDIMEHKGSELNKIYGTFHYPGRSGGTADGSTRVISNASTEFHIYSMEWTPSYIRIYVDNLMVHSLINSASVPFNQDFFLLINLAMGGTFGGNVDPAFTSASLEVDYIRVYK